MTRKTSNLNGLSFDIEEWFHILNLDTTPPPDRWSSLRQTVVPNTERLLAVLDEAGVRATFFVLGWVARHHPELVRTIHAARHEIACHGDMHELCYLQGPQRFEEDLKRAQTSLEDLIGTAVLGYRAPGFSILADTPWAFDVIRKRGFCYDSSIFPARRQHGGVPSAPVHPYKIPLSDGQSLAEFPMSVARLGPLRIAFAGGGYLRLAPYLLIRAGLKRMNRAGDPGCVYLHPREFDPTHPRIPMSAGRRFRSYVNLASTEPKLRRLLRDFSFAPLSDILAERGLIEILPRG